MRMKAPEESQPLGIKNILVFASTVFFVNIAYSNPSLDNVAAGNVTVSQTATTTTVNQASQQAIINWNSFNIAAGEKTQFVQPNSSSVALNRINPSQGASQIYGSLSSNGQIILINGAGIHFGPGSMVNVGGMIASTTDISNANFLAGNYNFNLPSSLDGSIVNEGTIIAAKNGLIALLGSNVQNDGMIQAEMGSIVLGSGNKFTLDFYGDQLINFSVDEAASRGGKIKNTGTLLADGGKILVTAKAASGFLDNVIDMQGVAQAKSVYQHNGEIILSGNGKVSVSGKLNVGGRHHHSTGGTIQVLGQYVHLLSTASLNASGAAGGGTILVGGNFHGAGPEQNALTTRVDAGAILQANALKTGNGGKIAVWSNEATQFAGSISAMGGALSGDGGFVETSGHDFLGVLGAKVNLTALHGAVGTWLLDPSDLTISTNATSNTPFASNTYTANEPNSSTVPNLNVTDLNAALTTANVTILTSVSGTGGFGDIIIGQTETTSGGALTSSPVSISWSSGNTLTLSAYRNISLASGSTITSTAGNGSLVLLANNAGAFTSNATGGTITNSGTITISGTGTVSAYYNPSSYTTPQANSTFNSGTSAVTAYMLLNTSANIQSISTNLSGNYAVAPSNIDISSISNFSPLGAYTGKFDGLNHTISGLTMNASVSNTGFFNSSSGIIKNLGLLNVNVISSGSTEGALVGTNTGTITNVYVTGSVTGTNNSPVGGIAGVNSGSGTISNSYNAANVTENSSTAVSSVGGIAGNSSGTILNSYNIGNIVATFSGAVSRPAIGGIVGTSSGVINYTYNAGSVTVNATNASSQLNTGGILGSGSGVTNSYNTGNVTCLAGQMCYTTGGISGYESPGSAISNVYNTGAISTPNGNYEGVSGIMPFGYASIINAYNTGAINGGGSFYTGGITASYAGPTLTNLFNSGYVSNGSAIVQSAIFSPTMTGLYYDSSTSNVGDSNATALTHAQTTQQSIFSNFSFYTPATPSNVWVMAGTPHLTMENTSTISGNNNSMVINNATQLQLISVNLTGNYTIGSNINLAATSAWNCTTNCSSGTAVYSGFTPIGTAANPFTGTLNGYSGQQYLIQNLFINAPSTVTNVGLFGVTSSAAKLQNMALLSENIIGNTASTNIGGLVGLNNGTILSALTVGSVIGSGTSAQNIGGLVGQNSSTGILGNSTNGIGSTAMVNVAGNTSTTSNIGGLAGLNSGTITNGYYLNSANTVSGNAAADVGGLIGQNTGTVTTSYDATLTPTASTTIGNFIGVNSGTVSGSFWDQTIGGATGFGSSSTITGGAVGNTTSQLQTLSTFTSASPAWNISNSAGGVWGMVNGVSSYPFLQAFSPTYITVPANTLGGTLNLLNNGTVLASIANSSSATVTIPYLFNVGSNTGDTVLVFVTAGSGVSNAATVVNYFGTPGGTSLQLTANTLTLSGGNSSLPFTSSSLGTALGSYTGGGSNVLYSYSPLTLQTVNGLSTVAFPKLSVNGALTTAIGSIFTINSNITSTGSEVYGGTTTLSGSNPVTLTTTGTNTDIILIGNMSWTNSDNLTLSAARNVVLDNATITNTGGANVSLIADNTGSWNGSTGTIGKVCGAGDASCNSTTVINGVTGIATPTTGSVSVSGSGVVSIYFDPNALNQSAVTEIAYTGGTTPLYYRLINEAGTLSDAATVNSLGSLSTNFASLSSFNFALGTSFSAAGIVNFTPIANGSSYTTNFDGLNHTVSNLTINSTTTNTGLFSQIGSASKVSNLGLLNVTITSTNTNTGALVGTNSGTLTNDYVGSGSVTVTNNSGIGGLAGISSGIISNSYNAASVTDNITSVTGPQMGGLVGIFSGSGSASNSYNTGNVSLFDLAGSGSLGVYTVGGFVSSMGSGGTITNSYNTGNLVISSLSGASLSVNQSGLFVGSLSTGSTISNVYNTGSTVITGTGNSSFGQTGGIVGSLAGGKITNAYNTGNIGSAGSSTMGGIIGVTNFGGGTVVNVYNTGNITGSGVAGIVGVAQSGTTITNAYNTGLITGSGAAAIATSTSGITLTKTYYNSATSGGSTVAGGGTALTAAQTTQQSSFGFIDTSTQAGVFYNPVNTAATTNGNSVANSSGVWLMAGGSPHLNFENTTLNSANNNTMIITTPTQLQLISANLTGNYILANNINLAGTSAWNCTTNCGSGTAVYSGFNPIGVYVSNVASVGGAITGYSTAPFTGTITGGTNYPSLMNLYINLGTVASPSNTSGPLSTPNYVSNIGFIGSTSSTASLQNFALLSTNITGNTQWVSGAASTATSVGALVGLNAGAVGSVFISGAVAGNTVSGASLNIGSLVGINSGTLGSTTTGVGSQATLTTTDITPVDNIGGLVGSNSGSILNAYYLNTTGTISGGASTSNRGGLIGLNSGTITNAYSATLLSGSAASTGGFDGSNTGTISASFFDSGLASVGSSTGATGNTTIQLQTQATYPWNFSTIWGVVNNVSYPYLQQYSPVILTGTTSAAGYVNYVDSGVLSATNTLISSGQFALYLPYGSGAHGDNVLLFVSGTATATSAAGTNNVANIVLALPSTGATVVQGLTLDGQTVSVQGSQAISNSSLGLALGSYNASGANTNVLYSYSGTAGLPLLTVGNTTNPNMAFTENLSSGIYTINSNITSGGTQTYNSATQVSSATPITLLTTTLNSDIVVSGNMTWDAANNSTNLTLSAYRNIVLNNANITNTGGANVSLIADNTGSWNVAASTGTIGKVCGAGSANGACAGYSLNGNTNGRVALSGGSGTVNVFYDPTNFGTTETSYSGGTTPTNYMLVNELGTSSDTATLNSPTSINSLGALSNSTNGTFLFTTTRNYALGKNIDATATNNGSGWSTAGFTPIGSNGHPFKSNFNGQGYTISNLYINLPSTDQVGLFNNINGTANITQLILNNANITGNNYVGGIVGYANSGANISYVGVVNSNIQGLGQALGGIVGAGTFTLNAAYNAGGSVNYLGAYGPETDTGGLVGSGTVTISNSYNTSTITGHLNAAGGLVGRASGSISNSFNAGTFSPTGSFGNTAQVLTTIGNVTLTNVYSTGNGISGVDAYVQNLGGTTTVNNGYWDSGTCGGGCASSFGTAKTDAQMQQQGTFTNYAFYSPSTPTNPWIMAGYPQLTIENTTTLPGASNSMLVTNLVQLELINANLNGNYTLANNINATTSGINDPSVATWNNNTGFTPIGLYPVYSGTTVTSYTSAPFNGLLNGANFSISNLTIAPPLSTSTGPVNIGLIASTSSSALIENIALVKETLTGTTQAASGNTTVGGLVGLNNGTILSALVTGVTGSISGTVTGGATLYLGGLVGQNTGVMGGATTGVGNTLNVSTTDMTADGVGGLVGMNSGSILNAFYNNGTVTGGSASTVGGLIGVNTGTITNAYSATAVTTGSTKGGFVGNNSGTLSANFWNTSLTATGIGTGTTTGAVGDPTATLQASFSLYSTAGWLSSVWGITNNVSYPYLLAFPPSVITLTNSGLGTLSGTNNVFLLDNGALVNSTPTALSVGTLTLPFGTLSSGDLLLAFLSGGATSGAAATAANNGYANTVAVAPIGAFTLNLANNTITGGSNLASSLASSMYGTALGSYSTGGNNLLYSYAASTLTVGNATKPSLAFAVTGSTTSFTVDSAITAYATGNNSETMAFAGPVALNNNITSFNGSGSGAQTFTGAVALGSNTTLASNGLVWFKSTLTGAKSLTVTGNAEFDGAVGTLSALSVSGTSAINANITTTGNQTYSGALTLTNNPTLSVTAASNTLALNGGITGSAGQSLTLLGGAGNSDNFTLLGPFTLANLTVTGGSSGSSTLTVGNANQTWNITGANLGNLSSITGSSITGAFAFSNMSNLVGGTGNDSFVIGTSGSIGTIAGGAGANSLSSANLAGTTWNISGSNTGSISGSVLSGFNGIQTLSDTRASGSMSFVFPDNINFSGTINGNTTNTDVLDYSAYVAAHAINASVTGSKLGAVVANSITTNFTAINAINGGAGNDAFSIGSGGSISTLVGNAGTNSLSSANLLGTTWNISGNNAGSINGSVLSSFTGMQTLSDTTASGSTSFVFPDNINFSGTINGNATNTDILDYSAYIAADTINASVTGSKLGNVVANSITANFTAMGTIKGGAANDTFSMGSGGSIGTLVGNAGTNSLSSANLAGTTWSISGSNAGSINGSVLSSFTGMQTLSDTTASGSTSFVFPDNINFSGTINGNTTNTDILDYSAYLAAHPVNANFTGSNAGSLLANTITNNFTAMGTVKGGAGINNYTFNDNVNFNGTINGGSGSSNTLDYNAYTVTHAISANITGAKSGSVIANSVTNNFTGINIINGGAANDSFSVGTGGSVGTLVGNGGLNSLAATNTGADTWTINGASNTLMQGVTTLVGSFTGIQNFMGTTGAGNGNTFNISTNVGTVTGGSSANTFNLNSSASATTLTAGSAGDTFNINTGSGTIATLNGGAGNDTINYTTGIITALNGNGGANTLSATNATGSDTWTITSANAGTLVNGSTTLTTFTGIQTIAGTNSYGATPNNGDTLVLPAASGPDFWTISTQYGGSVCTTAGACITSTPSNLISFSNIPNLQGSNNNDTFYPNALINKITAGSGANNTLDYTNGYVGTPSVSFGAGGSATNVTSSSGVARIVTASGSSLSGTNGQLNIWNITGAGIVSLNGGSAVSGITTLIGANAGDTYNFLSGGSVSTVTGGNGGVEQLNYGTLNTNLNIALVGFGASHGVNGTASLGTANFSSIDTIIGTTALTNILTGLTATSAVNAWTISSANSGSVVVSVTSPSAKSTTLNFSNFPGVHGGGTSDTITTTNVAADLWTINSSNSTIAPTSTPAATLITFSSIQNVTGGGSNNTFNISAGTNLTSLNGGNATNTLSATNTTGTDNWSISGVNAGSLSGAASITGFTSISSIAGGAGATNNLTATNGAADTWTVSSANAGNLKAGATLLMNFSGIQNLTGTSNGDTFTVNGNINGLTGIGSIGHSDIFNFNSGTVTSVTGGNFNDTFNMNGGLITTLTGGSGTADLLNYASLSGTIGVNLQSSVGININSFSNIEKFTGNDGTIGTNSTLTGPNSATWVITGVNAGNINSNAYSFTGFGNLTSGTSSSFLFNNGNTLTGNLAGGSSNVTFDGGASAITLNVGSNITTTGSLTFQNATTVALNSLLTNIGTLTLGTSALPIGNVTQSLLGTAAITATTLVGYSNGSISLPNSNNNITNIGALTTGVVTVGTVTIQDSGSVNVTGAVNTNNGAVNLASGVNISVGNTVTAGNGAINLTANSGAISQTSSGVITGGLLTTSSKNGTLLDTATNLVTGFAASNSTTGNINLKDSTSTLTLGTISETGGTVSITNTTGNINVGNTLNAATNAVNLTANSGAISQTSSGVITGGLLTTSSANGTLLDTAINALTGFTGSNSTTGNINLKDSTPTLTLGTINETGGTVSVTNTTGDINVGNTLNAATNAVNLTANSGAITQTVSGMITGGLLTTSSANGTLLDTATNAVTSFSAMNSGATGGINLKDSGALSVTSVSQINAGNNAGVNLTDTNALMTVSGNIITSAGNGNINLSSVGFTQNTGTTINSGSGTISINGGGGAMQFNSGTLQTTNDTANAVQIVNGAATTLGNINAANGALTLGTAGSPLGAVSQNTGTSINAGTIIGTDASLNLGNTTNSIANLGAVTTTTGGITVQDTTALTVLGNVNSAAGNGNISLSSNGFTQNSATTINSGSGTISINGGGAAIQFNSGTLQTTNATTNAVQIVNGAATTLGNINAANGTLTLGTAGSALGAVSQNTGTSINAGTIIGTDASLNLGNTTNSIANLGAVTTTTGGITVQNSTALTVLGNVNSAAGNGNISLSSNGFTQNTGTTINSGSGTISINGGGGAMQFNNGTLTTTNSGPGAVQIINGSTVALGNINASTGTVTLGTVAPLTGPVTQNSFTVIDAGTLQGYMTSSLNLSNSGNQIADLGTTTTNGSLTLNTTTPLAITGPVNTNGNSITLTSSGAINKSGAGSLAGSVLTTKSVGGQNLQGANAVSGLNSTNTGSGDINFNNTASPLTILGISQGTGSILVNNNGSIITSGPITTLANGNIALNALGSGVGGTINAPITAGGSGYITLLALSNVIVNQAVKSTSGAITINAGNSISLNLGANSLITSGLITINGHSNNDVPPTPIVVAPVITVAPIVTTVTQIIQGSYIQVQAVNQLTQLTLANNLLTGDIGSNDTSYSLKLASIIQNNFDTIGDDINAAFSELKGINMTGIVPITCEVKGAGSGLIASCE
jgi:hypothetical protein